MVHQNSLVAHLPYCHPAAYNHSLTSLYTKPLGHTLASTQSCVDGYIRMCGTWCILTHWSLTSPAATLQLTTIHLHLCTQSHWATL